MVLVDRLWTVFVKRVCEERLAVILCVLWLCTSLGVLPCPGTRDDKVSFHALEVRRGERKHHGYNYHSDDES